CCFIPVSSRGRSGAFLKMPPASKTRIALVRLSITNFQVFAPLAYAPVFNHSLTKPGQIVNQLESSRIGEAGSRTPLFHGNRCNFGRVTIWRSFLPHGRRSPSG